MIANARWLSAHWIRPTAPASTGSARCPDSSVRSRSTACTAYTEANTAMKAMIAARNAFTSPLWPPSRTNISRMLALVPTSLPTLFASAPRISP